MRRAGRTYLPQEPAESEEAYKNRLDRSVLTNLYVKTANKLVGKPLKKPIVAQEDVPKEILQLWDDIDNQGTNIDVFARSLMDSAVDDGVTHVLVDFTDTASVEGRFPGGGLTLEQAENMNVRPYARHVKATDLIGWKSELRNGTRVLTQIRILESAKVDVDEFNQGEVERIRVVEPFLQRVYEKVKEDGKEEDWILIEAITTTAPFIPLVTFYTNKTGFMQGQPWLLDIAHLQVAHWQGDSDQRNILHIARIPILFGKGFGDDDSQVQIEIGSNTFVRGPSNSDLKYVEHTGKGIEAGAKDQKDIEERIQTLGMEMLIKRPNGNETATARALDQAEADSDLGMVSRELENALEEVLDLFGWWLGLGDDSGGSVAVFKDFGIEAEDLQDIELLLRARAQGDLSQMTFFKELKRRGLLSDDFSIQDEIDLLDIESGGSAHEEPATGADLEEGLAQGTAQIDEAASRNQEGDQTGATDGHRHTLQANGVTDTVIDEDGVAHSHEWDEMGIRTSVEEGHSHTLLTRAAKAGDEQTVEAPPPQAFGGQGGDQ